MTKRIRFSLIRNLRATAPDGSPDVKYGLLENDMVHETPSPWSRERGETRDPSEARALTEVRLLPACWPSKIVCVGRNYREHAAELGNEVPVEPLIFLKPPSALIAHMDRIVYPAISQRVDFEGELGVVIGRRASHVKREDARACVFGYTCVNDVTARDLQRKDEQWTRAKGFDTFCPVGPWIVPQEEVRFEDIRVRTFVDDQKRQDASVREMIFSIDEIIEHVTAVMTLEPGDLIATGTPAGIGPIEPGSVVRVVVDGVGALENQVVKP
jgi:2-keto-4-pentenoate hydratase/2-oxohepta-3-ene-1,7-dioic acid hydratase in catechol pathway